MKCFLTPISIFVVVVALSNHHTSASPTVNPTNLQEPSPDSPYLNADSTQSEIFIPSSQPNDDLLTDPSKSTNTRDSRDFLILTPLEDDVRVLPGNGPILQPNPEFVPLDAYPMGYDDTMDVIPIPYGLTDLSHLPGADLNHLQDSHIVAYSEDGVGGGDMATAESNIVFRPLFTYRHQTAQRRRLYSKPKTTTPSPPRYSQTRREYPYGYPSYGYPNYYYYPSNNYPNYYYSAPYDYVA